MLCLQMDGQQTTLLPKDGNGQKKEFYFDYSFWSHDGFTVDPNGTVRLCATPLLRWNGHTHSLSLFRPIVECALQKRATLHIRHKVELERERETNFPFPVQAFGGNFFGSMSSVSCQTDFFFWRGGRLNVALTWIVFDFTSDPCPVRARK